MSTPTQPVRWPVSTRVNGQRHDCTVLPRQSLVDFLREELRLTGSHVGCEHGVCGACTVLVDGVATRGCLMFGVQADGADITTVEGLAQGGKLHALQEAFCNRHGLQCGFCTPGILMTLVELLRNVADPTEAQVREVLSGHLCRCTGYHNIVAAALEAVPALRGVRA
jgi:aerobic-type carbon monoxide dehydrogenase small subunit (CoxS/CutS family)